MLNLHYWLSLPPAHVAAVFIATEIDYGKQGAVTFVACAPVLDWEAVRMQMGCVKLTRSHAR
jgi:hypothetical protein